MLQGQAPGMPKQLAASCLKGDSFVVLARVAGKASSPSSAKRSATIRYSTG